MDRFADINCDDSDDDEPSLPAATPLIIRVCLYLSMIHPLNSLFFWLSDTVSCINVQDAVVQSIVSLKSFIVGLLTPTVPTKSTAVTFFAENC